jgi:hypothetical protein
MLTYTGDKEDEEYADEGVEGKDKASDDEDAAGIR